MHGLSRWAFGLAVLAAGSGGCKRADDRELAQVRAASEKLTPEQREDMAARNIALGFLIWLNDDLSMQATDRVLEHVARDALEVDGWITVPRGDGDGWDVDFFRAEGSGHVAVYRVVFTAEQPKGKFTALAPAEPMGGERGQMIRARARASGAVFPRCKRDYNTVILPGELLGRDGWLVYLLAAHRTADEIVVGGHARVHVSQDGSQIRETFALSRGCLVDSRARLPEGAAAAKLLVDSLVAPVPVESLVFLSLLHDLVVAVRTPDGRIWEIDPAKIRAAVGRRAG